MVTLVTVLMKGARGDRAVRLSAVQFVLTYAVLLKLAVGTITRKLSAPYLYALALKIADPH